MFRCFVRPALSLTVRPFSSVSQVPPLTAAIDARLQVQTFGVGLCAGTAGSLIGLGGAFVVLPWLTGSRCGLLQRDASGTSLLAILMTAIGSVIAYAAADRATGTTDEQKNSHVDFAVAAAMVCTSAPFSVLGARMAKKLPDRWLKAFAALFMTRWAIINSRVFRHLMFLSVSILERDMAVDDAPV
jgi:hypothetical protein